MTHAPIQPRPDLLHLPALPRAFFARPAERVAPERIGCRLVKRQPDGRLPWGVIVETEADCQSGETHAHP